MRMVRACLLLLLAQGVAVAAPEAVTEARGRLDALESLLGRAKSSDGDLIAAIDAVGLACADLAADGDPRQRERFLDDAAAALLKALRLGRADEATKRNPRNAVQLAAARAFRHVGRERAPDLMRFLERHILEDRGYDVDPSFYDALLDPLVRLRADGTFEWLLDKVVNADTAADSREQALAGLDALLRLPATGAQRFAAVKRLIAIYQSYMFHVEDDAFEAAGFRGTSTAYRGMHAAGIYWEAARPTVMRALRQLSTDPRTGLPPSDLDTKGEIDTIERYQVWFGQNRTPSRPPWIDAEAAPRVRADAPYTRPLPLSWNAWGVPWQEAWRWTRQIVERPLAVAAWRDELRAKTLPDVAAKALGDPAWEVRAAAALAIARIGAEGAAERLRERIDRDPAEPVREAAMLGLLLLADEKQRDLLRERAADAKENPRLRAYALLALGFLKDGAPLRAALASEDAAGDLRACAVRALGHAGGPAPGIAALLVDRHEEAAPRGEAGAALLATGDASILPLLLPVLNERVARGEVPVAQTSVAIAMGLSSPDDAKTLRRLGREAGEAEFAGVRTLLAASLARSGGARGAEILVEEYGNLRPKSTRFAERGHFLLALGRTASGPAKDLLRKEIETLDHDWDLGACALGLAVAGEHGSLPTLRIRLLAGGDAYAPHGMVALALLADPTGRTMIRDALARRRADAILEEGALALALLDGEKALPDLLALWERGRRAEHFDAFAWAFRIAAAADAIAPLRAMVEGDRDPVQRAFALMALGRMADPAEPLHRLARDSNPYSGSPTLLDLARWRDAAPLLD
jgi:HEAT repeat protein